MTIITTLYSKFSKIHGNHVQRTAFLSSASGKFDIQTMPEVKASPFQRNDPVDQQSQSIQRKSEREYRSEVKTQLSFDGGDGNFRFTHFRVFSSSVGKDGSFNQTGMERTGQYRTVRLDKNDPDSPFVLSSPSLSRHKTLRVEPSTAAQLCKNGGAALQTQEI